MALEVPVTIFHYAGTIIDSSLAAFISNTASGVISGVTTTVVSFGTLYFVALGYMIMMGQVQEPAHHFFKNMAKFLLISALALNSATYLAWVVQAIYGLESGLTSLFSSALPGGAGTVYDRIDVALSKGLSAAKLIINGALDQNAIKLPIILYELLIGAIVAVSSMAIVLPAGAIIIVAKAMLSVMLGIGPIFIMMLLFGQFTSQWFDRWFGQVMTYVMQIALVTTVLSLGIVIYLSILDTVPFLGSPKQKLDLWKAIEIVITAVVSLALIQQANTVAGQLAGGISSAGITLRQMGNAAKEAGSVSKKAGKVAGYAAMGGASLAVGGAGLAAGAVAAGAKKASGAMRGGSVTPAYRQAATSNLNKGGRGPK